MNTLYVFLADGFEEIEVTIPVDFCIRANIKVRRVAVYGGTVRGNSGGQFICDDTLESINPDNTDILFIPGGAEGAKNASEHMGLIRMLKNHDKNNGIIAAICIAPAWVLGRHGMLAQRSFTCYPGGEKDIQDSSATFIEQAVVKDRNIITSRGIGTATQFAIELITIILKDQTLAKKIWNDTLQPLSTALFPNE